MFKGFQVGAEKVNVSHLQLADDTLIFMDVDPKLGNIFKSLFRCFKLVSELKVNWSKSHILGSSLSDSECAHLANLLGYTHQEWPTIYLSLPLGGSSKKTKFWNPVSNGCNSRKANYLSFGGRVTLIKATLSNLSIYYLSRS